MIVEPAFARAARRRACRRRRGRSTRRRRETARRSGPRPPAALAGRDRRGDEVGMIFGRARMNDSDIRLDAVLRVFPHAAQDGLAERLADALDRDAVENLLEKAADDQPRRFLAGQAAGLGVEDQLFIDLAASWSRACSGRRRTRSRGRESSRPGRRRRAAGCRSAGSRWSCTACGSTLIMPRQTVRDLSCRAAL